MLRSLDSGVSALQRFQERMDVIGNNISNVNTTGFKAARTEFADAFNQSLRLSTAGDGAGGNSSIQIGLGVATAAIRNLYTQGAITRTGVDTDLAITGEGFFVVADKTTGQQYATRDGQFKLDKEGFLVTNDGLRIQGFSDTGLSTRGDIKIAYPNSVEPGVFQVNGKDVVVNAGDTREVVFERISAATGGAVTASYNGTTKTFSLQSNAPITLTNSSGQASNFLTLAGLDAANFTGSLSSKSAVSNLQQTMTAGDFQVNGQTITIAAGDTLDQVMAKIGTATAGAVTASYDASTNKVILTSKTAVTLATPPTGGSNFLQEAQLDAAQYSGRVESNSPVGDVLAQLNSYSIGQDGKVTLRLTDGREYVCGQVLLQSFSDPQALVKEGQNLYSSMDAAGPLGGAGSPTPQVAGTNGLGTIQSKALELSNVDLTNEFSTMITTQRSFQAAARVITTSDEMLNEAVNLKR